MQYIIENCPLYKRPVYSKGHWCYGTPVGECNKRPDCLIKQVIEKCKEECGNTRTIGKYDLANEILQLFDIEEINK